MAKKLIKVRRRWTRSPVSVVIPNKKKAEREECDLDDVEAEIAADCDKGRE